MIWFDTEDVQTFCGIVSQPNSDCAIGTNGNDGKGARETGTNLIRNNKDSLLQYSIAHLVIVPNALGVGM